MPCSSLNGTRACAAPKSRSNAKAGRPRRAPISSTPLAYLARHLSFRFAPKTHFGYNTAGGQVADILSPRRAPSAGPRSASSLPNCRELMRSRESAAAVKHVEILERRSSGLAEPEALVHLGKPPLYLAIAPAVVVYKVPHPFGHIDFKIFVVHFHSPGNSRQIYFVVLVY